MKGYGKEYQVIVVGAGHAGCEAALASARMGCTTLLLTMGLDVVAMMSCNPAIGGLAKGHLVHEIDALGGEMGLNIDATAIQFRRLNTRKGPAVRASRAQADRMAYSARMKRILESEPYLDLKQGAVVALEVGQHGICGVKTREGLYYAGRNVVLTTGTFMRGLIHVGLRNYSGGRAGEPASEGLSDCLRDLGFRVGRLKTGTPARLSRRSIDFTKLETQTGDDLVKGFSFLTQSHQIDQVPCYIANTNEKTHDIIRKNLHQSPLYSGVIEGIGPRYCPSIEDKVVRFPDRKSHQTFLEPEGRLSAEMYPSGMSTSLPPDVQLRFYRSMVGLEKVEIMRPGYAIEYDFVEPVQITKSLETKRIAGLFHAGQINGTSGYEEAAAQGVMAGINAARRAQQKEPLILGRDQAYIGVMIDDLTTQPTREPYRMFTSRSEYRLLLREDNADQRLTPEGRKVGLVTNDRWLRYEVKQQGFAAGLEALERQRVSARQKETVARFALGNLTQSLSLKELLKRPEIQIEQLCSLSTELLILEAEVLEQLEIAVKYEGYIARQYEQVARMGSLEGEGLPPELEYSSIRGLSQEVKERLSEVRPETLGQASRIQGVTPAAIAVLSVYLKRWKKEQNI
ncbi:tRNA uridine-5-carboxymethylaminomethyl(34) synthesis enzyme MnmG [Geopsychrobacter electrodiphilus]|uniref:tRNA uridine-5-carboxymethylaminomethyl(34) synthesis enzyme MnmG n=1 Tax=Geopsychrobacter electrodiphilus TaxID=225196 RepID=UPI00035F5F7F|nr:tRNA uridine-5-carboxymethylaminomethyl(34) synthesis enzyme MnmG [Geopsychrobacter electrodiphilus]